MIPTGKNNKVEMNNFLLKKLQYKFWFYGPDPGLRNNKDADQTMHWPSLADLSVLLFVCCLVSKI